jgi:hypothetical protein
MSSSPISLSRDLVRLVDEGYEVEIRYGYLLIKHVPYVNSRAQVGYGTLVSELTMAGDVTDKPSTHVAMFAGDHPCHRDGSEITQIKHQSSHQELGSDLVVEHSFSSKPATGYPDYHAKMTAYVAMISGPAEDLDPKATARTYTPIEANEPDSVFQYIDTASGRAQISNISAKLGLGKIGIVGLGGTGAYILDLACKTHVREIHLFDGDRFRQHNAFRSPGAASLDDLRRTLPKVQYLVEQYSKIHRGVRAHPHYIDASNVDELREMEFVFVACDDGKARKLVVCKLQEFGIPFIDVGMGVYESSGSLAGQLRTTTGTPSKRDHVPARIGYSNDDPNNEYSRNIQIADLNALNAALAVIKWKKLFGFYVDLDHEHHSVYTINGNCLTNGDCV